MGLLERFLAMRQLLESLVGVMPLLGSRDSDLGVFWRAVTTTEDSEVIAHEDLTKKHTWAILLRNVNLHKCWLAVVAFCIRDHVLLSRDLVLLNFPRDILELVSQRWVRLV